ncbi:MAG: HPF/RaiA family ribosome-associated protein [Gemmatimonadaceae bacterium]
MHIVFQAHHARVSEPMRERARRAVHRVAGRVHRAVDAIVRFEADGPVRRVEIVLRAPRKRPMIAEGSARVFGAALATAVARLQRQAAAVKHSRKGTGAGRLGVAAARAAELDVADLVAGDGAAGGLGVRAPGAGEIANA